MPSNGVLRVTVHYVYHPVTEETLRQVFEAYGVQQISIS
jgi:homospermidine synthase